MFDFGKTLTLQGLLAVVIAMLLLSPASASPIAPQSDPSHYYNDQIIFDPTDPVWEGTEWIAVAEEARKGSSESSEGYIEKNGNIDHEGNTWVGDPFVDADGDGYPDIEDGCPGVSGESSQAGVRGCPDADSDGWADKIDVCPTQADHEACLRTKGLYVYPDSDQLMTCRDMSDWESELDSAKYWAVAGVGLAALLMLVPAANVIVVVKVLAVLGSLGTAASSTMWGMDTSEKLGNLRSVMAQLGC